MTEPEQWAVELWHRFHRAYLMEYCESHQQGVQSAALTIQRAFEERTGQLIPAPSVDDAMVDRVARAIANADLDGPDPEDYWQYLATAAISAMQVKP